MITSEHVDKSIARALAHDSGLDAAVLEIHGFSTPVMRRLFNNLCSEPMVSYLEIGTFCGASIVAAANNNPSATIVGVDHFEQKINREDPRKEFFENIKLAGNNIAFVEGEAFSGAVHEGVKFLGDYEIFYYDGWHEEESHAQALPFYFDCLDDQFLFIVDDINWPKVRQGTAKALETLKNQVLLLNDWQLRGEQPENDPIWHNGLDLYLLQKIK